MSEWSLSRLLANLHEDIQQRLETVRKSFNHPGTTGDASEKVWLKMLQDYLPTRYQAVKAHVVDSKGKFSQQIDIVIFDRQYSPFIFNFQDEFVIPAESVYAVFEAKQTINAEHVRYAQGKVNSVRQLHRTSIPIPHAGGIYPAKTLNNILGGILTLESDWSPPLGDPLKVALGNNNSNNLLNMGCVAANGYFQFDDNGRKYIFHNDGKPATEFLFNLISQLQLSGTVPMIDVQAYAQWLTK